MEIKIAEHQVKKIKPLDENIVYKWLMSFADVDTIHFSNKYKNSLDLIQQAYRTLKPTPVNYNNAKISGWVD